MSFFNEEKIISELKGNTLRVYWALLNSKDGIIGVRELQRKLGLSIILISHDLSILGQACDRVLIMYAGKIVEIGEVDAIFRDPLHPYTRALLSSFPDIRGERRTLRGVPGSPPDLLDPPSGCRLHPRCPQVQDICKEQEPPMKEAYSKHVVACHMSGQGG